MEDCDGVYNLAKAPIKNCLSDFIHLNYSGVPFYVSYLLSGPSFLVCGTKRDFFLPKIVFLCKKSIIIIIIAAKKRQRMESFVRMTLGRRQVNFVQAVIPLHTSSPSSSPSSSSPLSSLSISYHHQPILHHYHCHTHHYHRHRRRHCHHQDLVAT